MGLEVARNFYTGGPDLLHPRIDENEGRSGIIGMEFPLMNAMVYVVAEMAGWDHWYGRLINLIVSSLGIWFFYLFLKKLFQPKIAFVTGILVLGSLWFSFARKTMPDTFSMAFMMISLYSALLYVKNGNVLHLCAFLFLSAAGLLSKLPAGIIWAFLIFVFLKRDFTLKRKLLLLVFATIPLIVAGWWYFSWCPYLSVTYGYWFNDGNSVSDGLGQLMADPDAVLKRFGFDMFSGFVLSVSAIAAAIWSFIVVSWRMRVAAMVFGLAMGAYLLKSGFFFVHHNYYALPLVPFFALALAFFLNRINVNWLTLTILVLGVTESIANQQHDFFIKESEAHKPEIEFVSAALSRQTDLIAVNGNGNPQLLYFSNRKGWVIHNEQVFDESFLTLLKAKGCRLLIVDKTTLDTSLPWKPDLETPFFAARNL